MAGTSQNLCIHVADSIELQNPNTPSSSSSLTKFAQWYPPGFSRKVFAEVIGTFLLVFVGSGSAGLATIDANKVSKLAASIAAGLIVTVMIYSIGHISGAHMNPAVSLAFAAAKHFPWPQVPFYAAAQLTGSISASYTLRELFQPSKLIGQTQPAGSHVQALIMEMVTTFTMVFITMAVATDTKATGTLSGVAVGSSVSIASIVAGPISGGSMNPARTLGPAIAIQSYKGIWVYFVGPITGALLAAWSYNVIKESDKPAFPCSLATFSFKLPRNSIGAEQFIETDHRSLV